MRRLLNRLGRGAARRALLLETALFLLLARLALRVVPFRRLTWFFERPARQPELEGSRREQIRAEVQRAIYLVAPRLPGQIVCFPKAIAAQAMLRRRGIAATLYYGAKAKCGTQLQAHVWVQDGDHPVVGQFTSQGYAVLSRYPSK